MRLGPWIVLVLVAIARTGHAQESSTFQINPERTGSTLFPSGLKTPLTLRWYYLTPTNSTYPVIADGKVYVATTSYNAPAGTYAVALDLATGSIKWRKSLPPQQLYVLTYADGKLFALSGFGEVICLDSSNGNILWQLLLGDYTSNFDLAPVAKNGAVYIHGGDSTDTIYALRSVDGAMLWSQSSHPERWGSMAVSDTSVFASTGCTSAAFDALTGHRLWTRSASSSVPCQGREPTQIDYENLIYSVAFSLGSGRSAAEYAIDGTLFSVSDSRSVTNLAVQLGTVFYKSYTGGLDARRAADDTRLWTFPHGSDSDAPPVVVNNKVLYLEDSAFANAGTLDVIDGSNGQLLQALTLPASAADPYHAQKEGIAAGEGTIVVAFHRTLAAYTGAP